MCPIKTVLSSYFYLNLLVKILHLMSFIFQLYIIFCNMPKPLYFYPWVQIHFSPSCIKFRYILKMFWVSNLPLIYKLNLNSVHGDIKVAFIQKGLMSLSFLQTDEPNFFPELKFWFLFHSKWLESCQIETWNCSECSNRH